MIEPIHFENENADIRLSFRGINKNLGKAQFWLDTQIMNDCVRYMPMQTGIFIQKTRAKSSAMAGSGYVCVADGSTVYWHFLYEGVKLVDSVTGKGARRMVKNGEVFYRHRLGAHLVQTDEPITYSRRSAQPHWFTYAKDRHHQQWVDGVKKIMGGE